jgi:hypothetical protein
MQKISINDIGNYGRASGQTFRRLLVALYEASTGERVTYVTGKSHLVSWYMNKTIDIARSYLSESDVKVEGSRNRITICGKGHIQFVAIVRDEDVNRLRGLSGKRIEDD